MRYFRSDREGQCQTNPQLDFGQFGRRAGERILQGKWIRQGILLLSRLGRDSEEIDAPHILRLEPSLTHSIFGQSQAKAAQFISRDHQTADKATSVTAARTSSETVSLSFFQRPSFEEVDVCHHITKVDSFAPHFVHSRTLVGQGL